MSTSRTLYDSARRPHPFLEELRESVRYRDLVLQLVSRDVKTRYKRSIIGIAWTMLNPLLMMTVLALVFSHLFRFELNHYPVYLLSGLVLWNFLSQTTTTATNVMRAGAPLLSKVYVPRTVFAVSAIGTGLVNLTLAIVPLILIAYMTGVPINGAVLWLVPAIILTACFALGVGLLVSTLAVPFPDVVEMYEVLLTAWYFMTPIIYPESMLSAEFRSWLVVNPMFHLVTFFRDSVHRGVGPTGEELFLVAGIAVVTLIAGWYVFSSRADEISARI